MTSGGRVRIIGIDPGLAVTGWGVIEAADNRLRFVAGGTVRSNARASLAERLVALNAGLAEVIGLHAPDEAAVEETFVNTNPRSTLKLGQARGVALLAAAAAGLAVAEYPPNLVKKSVVGAGHAAKEQVQMMVRALLPGAAADQADTADALAIAICHAHHRDRAALAEAVLAGEGT